LITYGLDWLALARGRRDHDHVRVEISEEQEVRTTDRFPPHLVQPVPSGTSVR
jgi:hypothetical protein